MMMKKLLGASAFAFCMSVLATSASAVPILGVNYGSAPGSTFCSRSACVGGYQFTVNTAITVTGLGAFDGAQGNPSNGGAVANLTNIETVDLFNSAGTVIGTVNVGGSAGGTQVGTWFAVNNLGAPLVLTSGTYIVAALIGANDAAAFPSPAPVVGSGITFNQFEWCDSGTNGNDHDYAGSGCTLSTSSFLTSSNTSLGFLGANIAYALGAPAPVPEPLTLSIFGAGLAGAIAMRRRKKS